MKYSVQTIYPYKHEDCWVFDDDSLNLTKETFLGSINTMIDNLIVLKGINNAEYGFKLSFSAEQFPRFDIELQWVGNKEGGAWYRADRFNLEGMLGPALFSYFDTTPNYLFIRLDERTQNKGINYTPTLRVSAAPPLRVGRLSQR